MESERDDVRKSVRGEFSSALDGLSAERTHLLNETADLRLQLAEAKSEREAAERESKKEMEMEAMKIHARCVQKGSFRDSISKNTKKTSCSVLE